MKPEPPYPHPPCLPPLPPDTISSRKQIKTRRRERERDTSRAEQRTSEPGGGASRGRAKWQPAAPPGRRHSGPPAGPAEPPRAAERGPRRRRRPAPALSGTAAGGSGGPSAAWGGGTGRSRRLLTWSRRRSRPAAPGAGPGTCRTSGKESGGSWRRPELGSAARRRAAPSAAPARRHYRPTTDTERRRRRRERRRGAGRERPAESRESRPAADLPNMAAPRRYPSSPPAPHPRRRPRWVRRGLPSSAGGEPGSAVLPRPGAPPRAAPRRPRSPPTLLKPRPGWGEERSPARRGPGPVLQVHPGRREGLRAAPAGRTFHGAREAHAATRLAPGEAAAGLGAGAGRPAAAPPGLLSPHGPGWFEPSHCSGRQTLPQPQKNVVFHYFPQSLPPRPPGYAGLTCRSSPHANRAKIKSCGRALGFDARTGLRNVY